MLNLLIDLLKAHSLYKEKDFSSLANSCCSQIKLKVLDFDDIKIDFQTRTRSHAFLKSADALVILPDKDEIHFVEMSSFSDAHRRDNCTCIEFVEKQFNTNEFPIKIVDSILILLAIAGQYGIDNHFFSYYVDPQRLSVKAIFVSDFSYMDLVTFNLATLPCQGISLTRRISGTTLIMNCEQFENYYN